MQRLALRTAQEDDFTTLFEPLLGLMEKHSMDFHATFRHLTNFRPSWLSSRNKPDTEGIDPMDTFLKGLLIGGAQVSDSSSVDITEATKDWLEWLDRYAARTNDKAEEEAWSETDWESARMTEGKRSNPRFVLRQWVLEELIKSLTDDATAISNGTRTVHDASAGRDALNKVLRMCTSPFDDWGAENRELETAEQRDERRLCGTGPKKLLGFQCSCSS